jgi:hypothetical protein
MIQVIFRSVILTMPLENGMFLMLISTPKQQLILTGIELLQGKY